MDNNQYFGQANRTTDQGEWNRLRFIIQQQMLKLETSLPVKVLEVKTTGVAPVGFVKIQILVDQITGDKRTLPGAAIDNVPYMRYQGGDKAVIIDPEVGDIGIACFSSRDMASVKAARKNAPPGSLRAHDCSDAMYIGGILNKAPTHYIHFTDSGILVHTPGDVKIEAGGSASVIAGTTATVTASTSAAINAPSVSLGAGGGAALRSLIDERFVSIFNGHTHANSGAGVPNQQIGSGVLTQATKVN